MTKKTEWPTAQKLNDLRSQGIVPISDASLRYSLLGVLFFLVGIFGGVFAADFKKMMTSEYSLESFIHGLTLILALSLTAVICVIAIGLFQTKFLIRLGRGSSSQEGLGNRFFSAVLVLIHLILIILSVFLVVRFVWPIFINLFVLGLDPTSLGVERIFYAVCFGVAALSLVMALSVWLRDWYRFMLRNRMSKAEINAEGRD